MQRRKIIDYIKNSTASKTPQLWGSVAAQTAPCFALKLPCRTTRPLPRTGPLQIEHQPPTNIHPCVAMRCTQAMAGRTGAAIRAANDAKASIAACPRIHHRTTPKSHTCGNAPARPGSPLCPEAPSTCHCLHWMHPPPQHRRLRCQKGTVLGMAEE